MKPTDPALCPECGKPVPADSQHQVCPACLMAQALASRTILPGGESGEAHPPLSPEEIAGRFPGYEILECLGRGGMGVVYKARQKSLDRWVAIKILPPERVGEMRFAERFAREAQTLARLSHPNIVTVFDYGETDGLFYIVMEYIDGVNLRDLLRDGKLEPQQALAIVPPICEALQYAHDKGIVHRDIKPENLLLDREGRIKIADFGIAALIGAGAENIGTPPYMAPEQCGSSSEVDSRADIYALGVVLYEMLTGERPNKDLVAPSRKVQIDVRLDEIVLRALEKTPELRYQTAGEFRTVVETVAKPPTAEEPGPSTTSATNAPASKTRKSRKKKVVFRLEDGTPSKTALLTITVLCLLLAGIVIYLGEPFWRLLTTTPPAMNAASQVPSNPYQAPDLMVTPSLVRGAVLTGMLLLAAILIGSLVLGAGGSGSAVFKGRTVGVLVLMLGVAILLFGIAWIYMESIPRISAPQPMPVLIPK